MTGDDSTRAVIAALSACTGMDIGTTCDSLNQLLQSFDMLADGLRTFYRRSGRRSQRYHKIFANPAGTGGPCTAAV